MRSPTSPHYARPLWPTDNARKQGHRLASDLLPEQGLDTKPADGDVTPKEAGQSASTIKKADEVVIPHLNSASFSKAGPVPPMLKSGRSAGYASSRLWGRIRVQLGGAFLFGVFLPIAILAIFYPDFIKTSSAQLTAGSACLAALLSVYLLRNISVYPGINSAYFVLPSVALCFGLVFAGVLLWRIDYSRALMVFSTLSSLIWLYVVQLMIERSPALRIGVIPFGSVGSLAGVSTLELVPVTEPRRGGAYDLLVADFRAELSDDWEAFLADCALAGVPVLHVKQLQESLTGQVEIEHLSENSFGSLIPFIGYLRLRRVIDFLSALVVGVLLLPVFVIVALLIKLDSPGPVLFRQVRIGYRGDPFRVAKFRTMVVRSAEDDARDGAMTKENDGRITRLGRFLRRSRIDELPQILNILRGEMSWIGPRPEAEPLSKWYESELPFYRYRHIVPPGITGWAQVNQGHVVELDQVMSKLHYDFYYIKNFSPWLDALIVAKTIQTVLTGFGSR